MKFEPGFKGGDRENALDLEYTCGLKVSQDPYAPASLRKGLEGLIFSGEM